MTRQCDPRVLLVSPRFSLHSFWNYKETCAVVGARYLAAPLGLITVAALLPREWNVRLVDCNTEDLLDGDIEWADLVMLGSMLPQQLHALRIIERAHSAGRPVVVGGPDVTASPDRYVEAEFRVLGEAEDVMDAFVTAWRRGDTRGLFTAEGFPDLKRSPIPRFDLLKLEHYMHVGVQFSRGCPYNCEFCNVIELNGRVPRFKQTDQILGELDCLYDLGYRGHVDFVDDNIIGNRRAARSFLTALGAWQKRRGIPFEFTSEASINLAEDADLLSLMRNAGFFAVFVGIESPDKSALLKAQKTQNVLKDITESVRRIHQAGIFVNAGFIVGLDGEDGSVSDGMIACIEEAAIPVCMVGLLYALPNTQLSRRLRLEGRLHVDGDTLASMDAGDQCSSGLNFETLRARADVLRDYRDILRSIYHPSAFFGRVRRMARDLNMARPGPRRPLRVRVRNVRSFLEIGFQLGVRDQEARPHFWRALSDCLLHNPRALRSVVSFAALYLHLGPFARYLEQHLDRQIHSSATHAPRLEAARGAPRLSRCAQPVMSRDYAVVDS